MTDENKPDETVSGKAPVEKTPGLGETTLTVNVTRAVQVTDTETHKDAAPLGEAGPAAVFEAGSYELGEVLGKGGMGIVYEAHDMTFDRKVAMKVMLEEAKANEQDRERFVEEAKITSRLEHPNIVPVHEMGIDRNGNVFFTMKRVQGVTLSDILCLLRKGDPEAVESYPLSRLLSVFLKVCDAVAFAHSREVVHYDLKPGNIMLGDYGEVLVLDWGLAKVVYKPDGPVTLKDENATLKVEETGSGLKTRGGSALGTPGFMAPELISPSAWRDDKRVDIYSLGAILYSILTLRAPAATGPIKEVLRRIIRGEIAPPAAFNPVAAPTGPLRTPVPSVPPEGPVIFLCHCPVGRIPGALSDIAMKAMACKPEERYPTVGDLQRDIETYQSGLTWNPVFEDDFSDPQVEARWDICGQWEWRAGELRLYGGEPQFLMLKQPLSGDVRIDFECRIESVFLNDVACFMSAIRSNNLREIPASGYEFKFGGYENTANVLSRSDLKLWSEAASPLGKGVLYKVRAERVGGHLRMVVNGREVFNRMDPDPLGGAERTAVGLLGWMTDSRYTRVRIYTLGTPWKADLLETADRHLQKGHYITALDLYEEVAESFPDATRLARARKGAADARLRREIQERLPEWRTQLQAAWPGASVNVRMDNNGLTVDVLGGITSLEPLRELPVTSLYCAYNQVADLSPLRGKPLVTLNCNGNPLADLSPLQGMPLQTLLCEGCPIGSLEPLRGLPLTMLNCGGGRLDTGLEPLRDMKLTWLSCWGCGLEQLEPLRGMPLTALYCENNRIVDLSPLRGMPLGTLIFSGNRVRDLSPLQDLPLTGLHFPDNRVEDLSPLQKLPLTLLSCQNNAITSLAPLQNLKLSALTCGNNPLQNVGPLIKKPPVNFFYDSASIPLQELEWMRQLWSRDFRHAVHALQAEILLACRTGRGEPLRKRAHEFRGKRYLFVPRFLTWTEACAFAQHCGGRLAAIPDREVNDHLNAMMPNGSWFWIGLENRDGDLRWLNGEPCTFRLFLDPFRERRPGPKIFFNGNWTCEMRPEARNSFMIEWDS